MSTATGPTPTVRPSERPPSVVEADGTVTLQGGRCPECDVRVFPFTPTCPSCTRQSMELSALSDRGTVYTHTTVRVGADAPYTLSYVDLDDGVRLLARVRGATAIDDRVRVVTMEGDAVVFEVER